MSLLLSFTLFHFYQQIPIIQDLSANSIVFVQNNQDNFFKIFLNSENFWKFSLRNLSITYQNHQLRLFTIQNFLNETLINQL